MKRPITNSMSDPPGVPQRKRLLSEEERLLWESVAGQTKPLRKKPRVPKRSPASAHPDPPATELAAPSKPLPSAKRTRQPRLEPSSPPLAPIGRRERAQLSRGRKEIDARLDLHGMTQTRAHRALSDFLQRAHVDGLTFVLVITGKGSAAPVHSGAGCCAARCRNGSVCRNSAPWWLVSRRRISAMAARARFMCGSGGPGDGHQNGRTIPTRGTT